jgi:hypothetical protein
MDDLCFFQWDLSLSLNCCLMSLILLFILHWRDFEGDFSS